MPFKGMFNSQDDPSGNSLRARASQYKTDWNQAAKENARQHGQLVSFGGLGPLQDPNWDAMFQAWDEAGVNKVGDDSTGVEKGMWSGRPNLPSTFNPQFQQSAVLQNGPSRQINSRLHPVLEGLRRATGRR